MPIFRLCLVWTTLTLFPFRPPTFNARFVSPTADMASVYSVSNSNASSSTTSANLFPITVSAANSVRSLSSFSDATAPAAPAATHGLSSRQLHYSSHASHASHSFSNSSGSALTPPDAGSAAALSTAVTSTTPGVTPSATPNATPSATPNAGISSHSHTPSATSQSSFPISTFALTLEDTPIPPKSLLFAPQPTSIRSLDPSSRSLPPSKPLASTSTSQPAVQFSKQFLTIDDLHSTQDPNFTSSPTYDRQLPPDSRRPSYASQVTNSSVSSNTKRYDSDDASMLSTSPPNYSYLEGDHSSLTTRSNSTAAASSSTASSRMNPIVFPQPVSILFLISL